MKILITGGAGFIGSNLAEALVKKEHKVSVVDDLSTGQIKNLKSIKKKINFYKIDISKEKNKKKLYKILNKIDWVFHLAGLADIVPSIENPDRYYQVNVSGTLNVLEAARANKVKKFIYAASASCYGTFPKYPTNEKNKIMTEYPYALTKNIGENLVLHWNKIYDLKSLSLRFFNAYGPKSRTTGAYGAVFGVFLAQKLKNKPLTIVGDGEQTRDFIHVFDLVSAIIKSATRGRPGEVYNVGSGHETKVNYIAKLIDKKKIYIPKRPGEPDRSLADISKIKKHLKWKPKIKIEYGVQMLLKSIKSWEDAPVWTPKKIKKATKVWFEYLK